MLTRWKKLGGLSVTAKYRIVAQLEVDGVVEKPDVVGALFGQTEGLLGEELDLRELQKAGRIGRIEVHIERKGNKMVGTIKIPSNLDRVETALIAAALETVDRVGPYPARILIQKIEDVRTEKRKRIVARARELLKKWEEVVPETRELIEEVLKGFKGGELVHYGPEKLPAGPDIEKSDTIIIVEGRADVLNLLRHGYRNVIALGGATTSIPKTIIELAKKKKTILFVDGDRGGELIIKNVLGSLQVDYIARAPEGREVEELTGKEITRALNSKVPAKEYLRKIPPRKIKSAVVETVEVPEVVVEDIKSLRGTLEAIVYDENWSQITKMPVRDLAEKLAVLNSAKHVVFDGIITQRLVDVAYEKGIETLVGARIGDVVKLPENLKLATFEDVKPKSEEESEVGGGA